MSSPEKITKPKTPSAKPVPPKNVRADRAAPPTALGQSATPSVVDAPRPVIVGPVMRKKELIDTVVERSGIKKKEAKPVVEAMLAVLGEALADNRELNLLPLGKIKVINEKDLKNGKMIKAKIRQVTPSTNPKPAGGDNGV